MKYKKGTFVVVPNTDYLMGKPQAQQLLFFWLCYHADEDGRCFPSRGKLAKEMGCTNKTVDNYIKVLEEDGVIEKTVRRKEGTKENKSNLYQILQVENVETLPSETTDPTPSEPSDPVTIPNTNYTHLTILPEHRGTTATQRVMSIYRDCFKYIYGFDYKPNFGRDLKLIKDLLESYSELQLARLLTIYLTWHGMDGSSDKDYNYLLAIAFPLTMFKANLAKYEAYSRNVLKDNFDDDSELLELVGRYILSLK